MFHFAISRSVELCRILTISQFDDDGKPIRRYRLNVPTFAVTLPTVISLLTDRQAFSASSCTLVTFSSSG